MRISLDSSTSEDFHSLIGRSPSMRVRTLTARRDGEPIGVGGFIYHHDGTVWASMLTTPECKRYPAAVYRAGVLAMRLAVRLGLRCVFATADQNEPSAVRFLTRLGFEPTGGEHDGEAVYCWRSARSEADAIS